MLTAQTEKMLFGRWQRERNRALTDPTAVSQTGRFGLTDLGVSAGVGKDNPDIFLIDNSPVDSVNGAKTDKIDIRNRPECG